MITSFVITEYVNFSKKHKKNCWCRFLEESKLVSRNNEIILSRLGIDPLSLYGFFFLLPSGLRQGIQLCVHIHVTKRKFERNSSLDPKV